MMPTGRTVGVQNTRGAGVDRDTRFAVEGQLSIGSTSLHWSFALGQFLHLVYFPACFRKYCYLSIARLQPQTNSRRFSGCTCWWKTASPSGSADTPYMTASNVERTVRRACIIQHVATQLIVFSGAVNVVFMSRRRGWRQHLSGTAAPSNSQVQSFSFDVRTYPV